MINGSAMHTFGDGTVCLFIEWKLSIPQMDISVWTKNGVRPNVPRDQAHRGLAEVTKKMPQRRNGQKLVQLFSPF